MINNTQPSGEKKLTLLLLCWFFGLLGVHYFYTGKRLAGGLQLLLLTLIGLILGFEIESLWSLAAVAFGVLMLWWVVDIARIIMGRFSDKEGKLITDWV